MSVRRCIVPLFRADVRRCSSPSIAINSQLKANNSVMSLRPSHRGEIGCFSDRGGSDRLRMSLAVNRGFESVLMQPDMSALFQCQCALTGEALYRKLCYSTSKFCF